MSIFKMIIGAICFKLARIKKNRIVFSSYNGKYSDSPLYISNEILKKYPNIDVIWSVEKGKAGIIPPNIKTVKYGSIKDKRIRGSAAAIVDNLWCGKSYKVFKDDKLGHLKGKVHYFFCKKKGQKAYSTWHGTPIKCMDRDQFGNNIIDFFCPDFLFVLNNKYTSDIMIHLSFERVGSVLLGSPRNEILYNNDLIPQIKEKLGLPQEKKMLLYAPTFRNDGNDTDGKNIARSGLEQLDSLNIDSLLNVLKNKFGGEWFIVCRFHYHVASMVNWDELKRKYNNKIVNGNESENMEEYLACADVLLTDYSSCMFDYAPTKKPCFLYSLDYEHYKNVERGFYIDVKKMPFSFSENANELESSIESFDKSKYEGKIDEMIHDMGFVDDQNSASKIADFIVKGLNIC